MKTQAKIDINPKAFNPKSNGKVPVSIVGTPAIDATQIDPATVRISRADCVGNSVAPLRWVINVVPDLLLHFSKEAMVSGLQLSGMTRGVPVPLVVTGKLRNGCTFVGSDCIVYVPGGD